jgi:hypothetical protein
LIVAVVGGGAVLVVVTAGEEVFPMGQWRAVVVAVGGPGALWAPGRRPASEIRIAAGWPGVSRRS